MVELGAVIEGGTATEEKLSEANDGPERSELEVWPEEDVATRQFVEGVDGEVVG